MIFAAGPVVLLLALAAADVDADEASNENGSSANPVGR